MAFAYVGLATPPAIMIAEWRAMGGLWLEKSALVTGQAEGVTLSSWCESHGGDAKRMASLAERLRDQFSKMARYRISHGDLKQSNIIIGPDDSLMFVDLDAVSFHSSKSEWEAGRSRDIKIFNANWTSNSPAATAFAEIFS